MAREVVGLLDTLGESYRPPARIAWPKVSNLTDVAPRPWAEADNGGIVCHCELVTRREIEAALAGPLRVQSLAGLKRRTRVTMGRCQGFYCLGALSEITAGRFEQDMALADAAED